MRKESKEERLEAGGEEDDAENVETDTSVNNHTTVGEVKSSEDGEAQEAEEGNTQDNSSSEELHETRVEDASVNVGEQPKYSCDQRLDGETETETQEQRGKNNTCPPVCSLHEENQCVSVAAYKITIFPKTLCDLFYSPSLDPSWKNTLRMQNKLTSSNKV